MTDREVLLEVKNLSVVFNQRGSRLSLTAVDDVSFKLWRGETLGVVGESGSGKTTIGRTIVRINAATSGEVYFKGQRISGKITPELDAEVTRRIQMIFQDPMASLNERAKVDYIVSEGLYNTRAYRDEAERQSKVEECLRAVGLLPEFASRFPHEFSGGQRQRIGVARALIMDPEVIIADEPISALDVSIRAQILNLLASLQQEKGLTYIFIAHDLSVVRFITDRVAVLSKGKIVELAETEELFSYPLHPYTRALLSAVPLPNPVEQRKRRPLPYDPSQHDYSREKPQWTEARPGHFVLGSEREIHTWEAKGTEPFASAKGGMHIESAAFVNRRV